MHADHTFDRRAFAAGAKALFDEVHLYMKPGDVEALLAWLDDLNVWQSGPVPAPPSQWPMSFAGAGDQYPSIPPDDSDKLPHA